MSNKVKLSDFAAKCLQFIQDNQDKGFDARQLAVHLWGEKNLMHHRVSNQGNGSVQGKAAWLTAGSYVGKLRAKGLVRYGGGSLYPTASYVITYKGREALRLHKADKITT